MSQQNVKSFMNKLNENSQLQEKLNEMLANVKEKMYEEIVELGNEKSLTFTKEDISQYIREQYSIGEDGELGDESLDAVSGGLGMLATVGILVAVGVVAGVAVGGATTLALMETNGPY